MKTAKTPKKVKKKPANPPVPPEPVNDVLYQCSECRSCRTFINHRYCTAHGKPMTLNDDIKDCKHWRAIRRSSGIYD